MHAHYAVVAAATVAVMATAGKNIPLTQLTPLMDVHV
jgi:hypothetical protein